MSEPERGSDEWAENMYREVAAALAAPYESDWAVLREVADERNAQRREWGDEHDDQHDAGDWTRFLVRHLGRAEQAIEDGDKTDWGWERQMFRIAALAVAAIQARRRVSARKIEAAHEAARDSSGDGS